MKLTQLHLPIFFVLGVLSARAVEVPFNYTFSANGYTDGLTGSPAPIATVSGSVMGSFVPGSFFTSVTNLNLNLTADGLSYPMANIGGTVEEGLLLPGGGHSGSFAFSGFLNDTSWGTVRFFVSIDDHLGHGFGNGGFGTYSILSTGISYSTRNSNFFTTPIGVPDYGATIAMFGAALTGLIAMRRRFE